MSSGAVAASASTTRRTRNLRRTTRAGLMYVFLIAIALLFIGPFVMMISVSFRPNLFFLSFPIPLVPSEPALDNYILLFSNTKMARWMFNSAFMTVSITLLQLVTSSMAGYAFSRGRFPGRDMIFWAMMTALMVPSTVTIVPLFMELAHFGWVNTYMALIVPAGTSVFGTFLLRQYIKTIPREYDEAALVDGAGVLGVYWRVVAPLTGPALATLATLTFLGHWNDFLYPLIVTTSADMRPLTVGLATMVRQGGQAGFEMAGATIVFLPTLAVFLALQKYVVSGLTLSGIKG